MKYIWSIVWILIGMGLMRYNFQIVRTFGKVDWAERKLAGGIGGTYALWKIVGLLVVIFALLYMFNAVGFILSPLSALFGGAKK